MSTDRPAVRVMAVFGTRPDTIKMAPLMRILGDDPFFDLTMVNTGQHDTNVILDILKFFNVHGNFISLDIMTENQSIGDLMVKVSAHMQKIIKQVSPEMVIVQGDTTTSMVAALMSSYMDVPVVHVEAGMRTGDRENPWPEEVNRIVIDNVSYFMFAPTHYEINALKSEGLFYDGRVFPVGNTSVDAQVKCCQRIIEQAFSMPDLYCHEEIPHVVITVHRRESFGETLESICGGIVKIASSHPEIRFVWPVHPNPNVGGVVRRVMRNSQNVLLCHPFSYMEMIYMIGTSIMVMTDSGGVQEDATSFGVPIVILRDMTDRIGHIGWSSPSMIGKPQRHALEFKDKVILAGREISKICTAFEDLLPLSLARRGSQGRSHLELFGSLYPVYGDGLASERIAAHIRQYFGLYPEKFPDPVNFE